MIDWYQKDEEGKVESVLDAGAVLEIYLGLCEAGGQGRPDVIGARTLEELT